VTYLALILLGYLFYQRYTEYKSRAIYVNEYDASNRISSDTATKYTIKINPDTKYEDYTLLQKFAYYFVKDKLPASERNRIEGLKKEKHEN
jgi:hypothetical protein